MAELEQASGSVCCSTDAQEACCEPSARSECCGDSATGSCGCSAGQEPGGGEIRGAVGARDAAAASSVAEGAVAEPAEDEWPIVRARGPA